MRQPELSPTPDPSALATSALQARTPQSRRKKLFRSVSFGRAVAEGAFLFAIVQVGGDLFFRIGALNEWKFAAAPLLFLLVLGTAAWSTRRLARIRPRWREALFLGLLGLLLALLDTGISTAWAALQQGSAGLSAERAVGFFLLHAIFFTIVVILTHLGQHGFLRFTMPKGEGRVTL